MTKTEYQPSPTEKLLLKSIGNATLSNNYSEMSMMKKDITESEAKIINLRKDLQYQESRLNETQTKLKEKQKEIAYWAKSVLELGCPQELLQEYWKEYSAHLLTEWLRD